MTEAIVFDIDGTLADPHRRLKFVSGARKDWERFYQGVERDDVIFPIAQLFALYASSLPSSSKLICITGRPERTRAATLKWFREKIGPEPDAIYMRKDHDFRPDVEVKKEWVEKLRADGYDILLAFEDRERVVKTYRGLGIQCCQVAEGSN